MAKYDDVNEHGILLLQFCRDTDDEMTYALKIKDFMNFLDESDKSSINMLDVV